MPIRKRLLKLKVQKNLIYYHLLSNAYFLLFCHLDIPKMNSNNDDCCNKSKRKRRSLIPYHQLHTKKHRIHKLQEEVEYLSGENHSKEDEEQLMNDLLQSRNMNIGSSKEQLFRNNIRDLLSSLNTHGLARKAIAVKLTKGLPIREAAEITGLTVDQIKKARTMSTEFDFSLLKMEASIQILFIKFEYYY
jgi:hypothetical protein